MIIQKRFNNSKKNNHKHMTHQNEKNKQRQQNKGSECKRNCGWWSLLGFIKLVLELNLIVIFKKTDNDNC